MAGVRLAVDYGTSNTVAVLGLSDGRVQPLLFDGAPVLPSAVYADPEGALLVGRDAQRSARLDPARYEPNPKRRIDDGQVLLGGQEHPVAELVGAALAVVAGEAVRVAGTTVDELVMTCPVEWGLARRRILADAVRRVGLPAPALLAEPVAAAAYFGALPGRALRRGQGLVVYDLGAGTFDVCAVAQTGSGFESLAHHGLDDFGGIDLDELIVERVWAALTSSAPEVRRRLSAPRSVGDRRAAQALREDARSVKETLSRHASAGVPVPLTEQDVIIGREEFEQMAGTALGRTVELTLDTIRGSGLTSRDLAGIFLVGGSSRVPLVATLLHRASRIAPTMLDQPETVVAQGALIAVPPGTPPTEFPPPPTAPAPPTAAPAAPSEPEPLVTEVRSTAPSNVPVTMSAAPGRRRRLLRYGAVAAVACLIAITGAALIWNNDHSHRPSGAGGTSSASSSKAGRYTKPNGALCPHLDFSRLGLPPLTANQNSDPVGNEGGQTILDGSETGLAAGCFESVTDTQYGAIVTVDAVFFASDSACQDHFASDKTRLTTMYSAWHFRPVNAPLSTDAYAYGLDSDGGANTPNVIYGVSDANLEILISMSIDTTPSSNDRSTAEMATQADALAHSLFVNLR